MLGEARNEQAQPWGTVCEAYLCGQATACGCGQKRNQWLRVVPLPMVQNRASDYASDEEGIEAMKILTVRQPWAWAIFGAGKDIENRSRQTKHRGPLAIHVSAFHNWREISVNVGRVASVSQDEPSRYDLQQQLGCVIGIVDVVDCLGGCAESGSKWAMPGHYHWLLANPRRVRPVPIAGQLGIFERDIELEELKR